MLFLLELSQASLMEWNILSACPGFTFTVNDFLVFLGVVEDLHLVKLPMEKFIFGLMIFLDVAFGSFIMRNSSLELRCFMKQ